MLFSALIFFSLFNVAKKVYLAFSIFSVIIAIWHKAHLVFEQIMHITERIKRRQICLKIRPY